MKILHNSILNTKNLLSITINIYEKTVLLTKQYPNKMITSKQGLKVMVLKFIYEI